MQCHTQVGSITTNIKVKIDFTLPEIRATEIVTWNFHVDNCGKGRYDMILGRYLLKVLGLNLKFFDHFIEADDVPNTMVDMDTYEFKDINTRNISNE